MVKLKVKQKSQIKSKKHIQISTLRTTKSQITESAKGASTKKNIKRIKNKFVRIKKKESRYFSFYKRF